MHIKSLLSTKPAISSCFLEITLYLMTLGIKLLIGCLNIWQRNPWNEMTKWIEQNPRLEKTHPFIHTSDLLMLITRYYSYYYLQSAQCEKFELSLEKKKSENWFSFVGFTQCENNGISLTLFWQKFHESNGRFY